MPKVACVTGANKGIGFEIVKLLCQKLKPTGEWVVLLAARNPELGEKAVNLLKGENLPMLPVYVQLNIRNEKECEALRDRIQRDFGGLDILVNNAAIAYKRASTAPRRVQAAETLETNYFATKQVTEKLLPLLRDNARIVTVSSSEGERAFKCMDESLRRKMLAPDLTIEELDRMMRTFIEETDEQPPALSFYGLSKAAVIAWTRVWGQQIREGSLPGLKAKHVFMSCCHPGWCASDMAGWDLPPQTAAEGAEAVVDVCFMERVDEGHGKYFSGGKAVTIST